MSTGTVASSRAVHIFIRSHDFVGDCFGRHGIPLAFYSVSVISASMEVIPQGKAGLFTALVGAGSAIGCLTGSLIAENIGFQGTFTASAVCFLLSFFAFEEFV